MGCSSLAARGPGNVYLGTAVTILDAGLQDFGLGFATLSESDA